MKQHQVTIGNAYEARVSGKVTTVRILSKSTYGKGWVARNELTGREVRILTAARLRPLPKPPLTYGGPGLSVSR